MQKLVDMSSRPERTGAALKQRVAKQIEPFLGPEASHRLLQQVSADGTNLLSIVEPVLAQFLGARAASELASHIVDAAIAET